MMRGIHTKKQVWLYREPVDFRKQMNGLIEVVEEQLKRRASDGAVYVFRSKRKDKVKVLMWDKNGFWLGYKRLEKGQLDFPKERSGTVAITREQYEMLISGMPVLQYGLDAEKKLRFS